MRRKTKLSAAVCRGLIEATVEPSVAATVFGHFPRQYAAASLKRGVDLEGLPLPLRDFPRQYAAASLKRCCTISHNRTMHCTFRGSMPRPH